MDIDPNECVPIDLFVAASGWRSGAMQKAWCVYQARGNELVRGGDTDPTDSDGWRSAFGPWRCNGFADPNGVIGHLSQNKPIHSIGMDTAQRLAESKIKKGYRAFHDPRASNLYFSPRNRAVIASGYAPADLIRAIEASLRAEANKDASQATGITPEPDLSEVFANIDTSQAPVWF